MATRSGDPACPHRIPRGIEADGRPVERRTNRAPTMGPKPPPSGTRRIMSLGDREKAMRFGHDLSWRQCAVLCAGIVGAGVIVGELAPEDGFVDRAAWVPNGFLSVVGQKVRLPAEDDDGRPLPPPPFDLIVWTSCGDCSVRSSGVERFLAREGSRSVVVVQATGGLDRASAKAMWTIHDPARRRLPPSFYLSGDVVLGISRKGVVERVQRL